MRRMGVAMPAAALLALVVWASSGDSAAMAEGTLYERLGGKGAITAVADEFDGSVAVDARINARFRGVDVPRLTGMLVDQISQATGGPCTYRGRSMAEAHRRLRISEAAFGAFGEDLVRSLDKFKVPAREQGELVATLGGMKGRIAGR